MTSDSGAEGTSAGAAGPAAADAVAPVLGSRVARNSIWSLTGSVVPAVAVTAASIVMARGLGPEEFGQYVLAVFVYGAATQLAVWGLPGATPRFLAVARAAGDEAGQEQVIRATLRGILLGTALSTSAVVVLALVWGSGAQRLHLLTAAAVVVFLAPTQGLGSVLSGRERFRELALWQIVVGCVNPGITIAFVLLGADVLQILFVDVAVTAGALVVLLRFSRPLVLRSRDRFAAPQGFWSFASAHAVLVVLAVIVFQRSEVLFLERYATSSDIAVYGVAFGLSLLASRITSPLLAALTPALARIAGPAAREVEARPIERALHLSTVLGLAISGIGWALAPAAVTLLYGEAFAGATGPARTLFLGSWAIAVAYVPSGVAQAGGRLRALLAISFFGAALNIGLNVALIPRFGPEGAAVSNTVAQVAIALVLLGWLVRAVPGIRLRRTATAVVPSVCAALSALVFASLPPLAALMLGGFAALLVFTFVARRLDVLDDEVVALGQELLGKMAQVLARRTTSSRH